jgi:hypothetical protein
LGATQVTPMLARQIASPPRPRRLGCWSPLCHHSVPLQVQ